MVFFIHIRYTSSEVSSFCSEEDMQKPMKLPSNAVNHLKQLPNFSAILWQANNLEQPIVVVKMPTNTNFASYAIGFGAVTMQSVASADATIRLTFLL
jgi:hypothetical protein